MDTRKFFGWSLVGIGALNILNFTSPRPIPTVGLGAVIIGGAFIAGGLALMGRFTGLGRRLRELAENGGQSGRPLRRPLDPIIPVKVLKLAERREGRLTISSVAMGLEIELDQAETALIELESRGVASSEVDPSSGVITWIFPEFRRG